VLATASNQLGPSLLVFTRGGCSGSTRSRAEGERRRVGEATASRAMESATGTGLTLKARWHAATGVGGDATYAERLVLH
jgi:hypothetical protein